MRIASLIIVLTFAHPALSKDPTVPSAAILKRLNGHIPAVAPVAPAAPSVAAPAPSIRLKAIVMNDRDHGIAIVVSGDQRFQLRLERKETYPTSRPSDSTASLPGFQLHGVDYTLVDFYDRTIILTDSVKRIMVY